MPTSNRAAWLKAKQDPTMSIEVAPYSTPGPREVVIRTRAVAVNPADWMLQKTGMLISKYPAILGCDAAGVIVEVGDDLSDVFKSGDRVIGAAGPIEDYKYAAFQEYVVLKKPYIAHIPDDAKFSDAVVLPLGFNTSASCLFAEETLALNRPPSVAGQGKTIVIWGASSSLGCCGVQLAVAAGYEVIAVASKVNHELLRSLGVSASFDYNDNDIVEQITNAIVNENVVGALDCISKRETIGPLCEILDASNASRKLIVGIQPGSEAYAKMGVTVKTNFVIDQASYVASTGTYLWQDFLPSALEAGKFQCKPDAEIVGHGLENVQKAVDLLSKGVSAKKLVVTL